MAAAAMVSGKANSFSLYDTHYLRILPKVSRENCRGRSREHARRGGRVAFTRHATCQVWPLLVNGLVLCLEPVVVSLLTQPSRHSDRVQSLPNLPQYLQL